MYPNVAYGADWMKFPASKRYPETNLQAGQMAVSTLWRSDNFPNRVNASHMGYDYTCGAPNETAPGRCGAGFLDRARDAVVTEVDRAATVG